MAVGLDAQAVETLAEGHGAALAVVVGDDHRAYQETSLLELVTQAQHIHVVGDAKVVAHLVFLYVDSADDNHNLGVVAELLQHPELAVGLESRQDAARVVVVKQFPPELEVELVAKLGDTFLYVFGLYPEIFLVVKTILHNGLQNYGFFSVSPFRWRRYFSKIREPP